VTVRVLPGGASFGEEIAAVQFVNSGVKTCTLVGYPTVTLRLHGRKIGAASQPSSTSRSMRTLHPGDVAESLVHDYTQTCQAPLSDSVQVQLPGTSITYVRPHMQLRACVLRVDRLGAPD
jgi:hypothetical protein